MPSGLDTCKLATNLALDLSVGCELIATPLLVDYGIEVLSSFSLIHSFMHIGPTLYSILKHDSLQPFSAHLDPEHCRQKEKEQN